MCAAGSTKLDVGMSMDPFQVKEAFGFVPKMKEEATALLGQLETWVNTQGKGLELASDPPALEKKFDSLLVVMDALFKVTCSFIPGNSNLVF